MYRFTLSQWLIALLLVLPPAHGASDASTINIRPDGPVAAASDFETAIAALELSDGAYAADLPEALLGLGLTLQAQGQHQGAIEQLKRGIHLTRVNDGLYSPQQIPLLLAEINSHKAQGNYAEVDQRQTYLYRVQVKSAGQGGSLADAYLQQADWQYDAYSLGLGENDFGRLMNMWDLYRLSLEEGARHEGDTSLTLLPALDGMLYTLYLMANYQMPQQSQLSNDDLSARANLNRFTAYRAQSYERGKTVIAYMKKIAQENEDEEAAARSHLMLGDWNLWNGQRDAAWVAYADAETELAAVSAAQTGSASPLAEPVALPDFAAMRTLPPTVPLEEGDILVEFGVTSKGKVVSLERLDDNEALDSKANRVMRQLRRTKFRPRFEAGEAVATDKNVRAFDLQ